MSRTKYSPVLLEQSLFIIGLFALSHSGAMGEHVLPAGRYLDQNVLVHQAEQLNPLLQVGDLDFSDRITVGEAVRTTLSGTGYRLDESVDPLVQSLLQSRIAISHSRFRSKRIDSVIAAIVGVGRGFDVQVDHATRRIRIVRASIAIHDAGVDVQSPSLGAPGGSGS